MADPLMLAGGFVVAVVSSRAAVAVFWAASLAGVSCGPSSASGRDFHTSSAGSDVAPFIPVHQLITDIFAPYPLQNEKSFL